MFIDPQWRVDNPAPNVAAWTHVDSYWAGQDYSTHWDSANATTMPVGPYHDSYQGYTGVSRSLMIFNTAWAVGKTINVARLQTRMVSAYNCGAARDMNVYLSAWNGGATTWNSQPGIYPDQLVRVSTRDCSGLDVDVSGMVRASASWGQSSTAFVFQAPYDRENALDTTYRRKFANNPSLYVEYNSKPATPTELSADNRACTPKVPTPGGTASGPYLPTRQPTLRARVADPDGGLLTASFRIDRFEPASNTWSTVASGQQADVASGSVSQWTPSQLSDGWHAWSVDSGDGIDIAPWVGWCYFTVDGTPPPTAKGVTSTDYPADGQAHGAIGQAGSFTIIPPDAGKDDINEYVVTVNDNQPSKGRSFPAAADKSAVIQVAPGQVDSNIMYVWARDRAGNLSDSANPRTYEFKAGQGGVDIAHWRMTEPAGSASVTDRLGARGMSLTGGASLTQGVLRLDGIGGGAATADPVVRTDGSFAVSAWVRLTDDTRTQTIVGQAGSQTDGFQLRYLRDGDKKQWELRANTRDVTNGPAWWCRVDASDLSAWHHLMISYDATLMTLRSYVNGSARCSGPIVAPFAATGPLHVGYGMSSGARADFFAGEIDDLRVWDRAVYPSELAPVVTAGDGLALRWDLDDNTSTVADTSGGGHPGVLAGGASWTLGNRGSADPSDLAVHVGDGAGVDTAGPVVRTDRSFTVAAWVRLDNADQKAQAVISQDGPSTGVFRLGYSNLDRWVFAVYAADSTGTSLAHASVDRRPAVGEWTHLVGVYDVAARQIRLYVNGKPSGVTSVSPLWNATGALRAGRMLEAGSPASFFSGEIDDVRGYSGALSNDDAFRLYSGAYETVPGDARR